MNGNKGEFIASSKGKRLKQFLGQNETLSLATSIANAQEKRIQSKTERNHNLKVAQSQQIPKTVSRSKSKLNGTKAMLVAQRAQAKRDKVRSRKQRSQDEEHQEGPRDGKPVNTALDYQRDILKTHSRSFTANYESDDVERL